MTTRNIIILPPPDVAQQAIAWSCQIASDYKTNFVLDGKQFYPHITLYQLAIPDKNLSILEQRLNVLTKHIQPFKILAQDFTLLVGFIFLQFAKTEELVALHKQVVEMCNPLREGENIPTETKNLSDPNIPEFIKHSIQTYGSALAMDAFLPHITLSRLHNYDEADKARGELRKAGVSFEVTSIHLANIGPDGTVNEIFKEFPFQMI